MAIFDGALEAFKVETKLVVMFVGSTNPAGMAFDALLFQRRLLDWSVFFGCSASGSLLPFTFFKNMMER